MRVLSEFSVPLLPNTLIGQNDYFDQYERIYMLSFLGFREDGPAKILTVMSNWDITGIIGLSLFRPCVGAHRGIHF